MQISCSYIQIWTLQTVYYTRFLGTNTCAISRCKVWCRWISEVRPINKRHFKVLAHMTLTLNANHSKKSFSDWNPTSWFRCAFIGLAREGAMHGANWWSNRKFYTQVLVSTTPCNVHESHLQMLQYQIQHVINLRVCPSVNFQCVSIVNVRFLNAPMSFAWPKYLVGGLEPVSCFHILGISSSQLTNSYFSPNSILAGGVRLFFCLQFICLRLSRYLSSFVSFHFFPALASGDRLSGCLLFAVTCFILFPIIPQTVWPHWRGSYGYSKRPGVWSGRAPARAAFFL